MVEFNEFMSHFRGRDVQVLKFRMQDIIKCSNKNPSETKKDPETIAREASAALESVLCQLSDRADFSLPSAFEIFHGAPWNGRDSPDKVTITKFENT
jgi:hypothetical protein